jgi:hypothetical protein
MELVHQLTEQDNVSGIKKLEFEKGKGYIKKFKDLWQNTVLHMACASGT